MSSVATVRVQPGPPAPARAPRPIAAVAPTAELPAGQRTIWLRRLLGRAVLGPQRQHVGHVRDLVVARTTDPRAMIVTGVIVDAGGHRFHVPASAVRGWHDTHVTLRALPSASGSHAGPDQAHLARTVLGSAVTGSRPGQRPRRITDVALRHTTAGWMVWAADTRTRWQRLRGRSRRLVV